MIQNGKKWGLARQWRFFCNER